MTEVDKDKYVLKMARVLHKDGPNWTVEIFTDDNYEIKLNNQDEFITVLMKEHVIVDG